MIFRRSRTRRSFLGGLAAAAAAGNAPAMAQAPQKLRIGITPSDGFGEAFFGSDAGFFAQAGITLDIQPLKGDSAILEGIATGSLDTGICTPVTMVRAALHGIPMMYIGAGNVYSSANPTLALIVTRNNAITQVKELEGATVGVFEIKDSSNLAVSAWLARNGADVTKIKFIELGRAEMVASVEKGTVTAGMIGEPFLSAGLASNCRQFAKPFDVYGDGSLVGGYITTADNIKTNAPLYRRFMAAMYKTAKWANANHKRTGEILQKYTKISDETVRTMRRAAFAETLTPAMIQPTLDIAYAYRYIDSPVKATDLIRIP